MIQPLKQSDVDGLCGILSVVNAVRYLYPDCLGDQEDERTKEFISELSNFFGNNFQSIWRDGCEKEEILAALLFVKEYGFDIAVHSLERMIHFDDNNEFWKDAKTLVDDNSIIVAGFSEPDPHWTLIKKISENNLYHFDSSVYNRTRINETGDNGWKFNKSDIFLIRRK